MTEDDNCTKKHIGARNEMVACTWLLNQGYEVFRNISPFGEVDVIARRGAEIVLIDVKGLHINADGYASATKNKLSPAQVEAGVKRINVFSGGRCEMVDEVLAISEPLTERPCRRCGMLFRPLRKTAQFCASSCKMAHWKAGKAMETCNV